MLERRWRIDSPFPNAKNLLAKRRFGRYTYLWMWPAVLRGGSGSPGLDTLVEIFGKKLVNDCGHGALHGFLQPCRRILIGKR